MARTPDGFDPEELDARWNDLTSRLGPLGLPPEAEGAPQPTAGPGPRDYEVVEDDSGFEEPDPAIGSPDPATALGWLALGIGILGVFVVFLTGAATMWGVLSTVVAVGGLLSLVVRLPRHSERNDDGAQV